MRRLAILAFAALLMAAPASVLAQTEKHIEFGPFADYYRFDRDNATAINFVGLGGRAGYYVSPWVSLEAEMSYDFARNTTVTTSNGVTSTFTTTNVRPLHGLFGPKFDFGTRHTNLFATGKLGFVNFSNRDVSVGGAISNVANGATHFALYPGVGVESFWGPFGMRAEVGDEIYFLGGAQHNMRITFGPHFRF
jgi:hypothetical protein